MVVKCSKCQGKMRVDQSRIPHGEKVKIRCPLCGEIQPYTEPAAAAVPTGQPEAQARQTAGLQKSAAGERSDALAPTRVPEELTIPADAFQDFRFPAERKPGEQTRNSSSREPRRGKGIGTWIFVLASIAVIIAFALIVNIILPGPAGKTPASGLPQWEENSTQKSPAFR